MNYQIAQNETSATTSQVSTGEAVASSVGFTGFWWVGLVAILLFAAILGKFFLPRTKADG